MYYDPNGIHTDQPAPVESCRPLAVPDSVRHCRRVAERIGAAGFSIFFTQSAQEGGRLIPVVDSDFPGVSLLSKQVSSRLSDRFCHAAAAAVAPVWWPAEKAACSADLARLCWADPVTRPAIEMAGLAFPVFARNDRRGLVVFAGNSIGIDDAGLCEAHQDCIGIFEDVVRRKQFADDKAPNMSKRELECLRLTANGLTSDDIATALGLSVHTANQYLTNTAHKLDAVNRVHAVAKALRTGVID